jgi:TraX protein
LRSCRAFEIATRSLSLMSKPEFTAAFEGKFPTDASLSLLKWLALLAMVVDHVNTYLFKAEYEWMFAIGRLSMPLFVYVLGCNLARLDLSLQRKTVYARTSRRLFICAAAATIPYVALNELAAGWWPLNFMFSLLAATFTIWTLDTGRKWSGVAAAVLVAWLGAVTDYWWPAIIACVVVWSFYRNPTPFKIVMFVACVVMFYLSNKNFWALSALPLILVSRKWSYSLPRAKLFFYAFYPLHFYALWLLKALG